MRRSLKIFLQSGRGTAAVTFLLFVIAPALMAQSQPSTLPQLNWHLTARPWGPLNSSRTNLLDKVENIVTALAPLQYWNTADPGDVQDGGDVQNGSIIDPYRLREHQYSTPYFSFAVATAVANGRATNLLEAGARALDHSTADIAGLDGGAQANDSHGEFFGAPMMKALRLYKQIAPQYPTILSSNRIARWQSRLTTSRVTYMNNTVGQNWRTYGMKGEWLRVQDGLVPRTGGAGTQGVDYIENYWLNEQRARFVRDRDSLGANPYFLTYHDDDPGPKQNFSYMGGATGNLLDMIYNGYDGPSAADIKSTIRFTARSCLLMTGGNGDAPAGGRTGNHVWNDVVWGNMFELSAEMAWADGDTRLAGQFRRAARLAFQSAWRYQQEQGWFSVTKSLLPAAHQNFYATWSALGNYNGYTEIHSSEAFSTELSPIPEEPAPAEIGGYVTTLDEQFDTTFINAGGMQAQICTEGSMAANVTGGLRWHTLGIVRFSRPGWETRLGPGDGWIKEDGVQAISFAPTFFESGAWQMVSQQPDRFIGTFTPTLVNPVLVRGTLNISPKSGQTGPSFAMNLTVTPDGVLVDTSRPVGTESFGLTWPLMVFDGKHVLATNLSSHIAAAAYPKMSGARIIHEAETANLSGGMTMAATQTNYSGTGYAVFPASGGTIEWSNIEGGDGGAATVGFRYTLSSNTATSRTLTLIVNGQSRSVTFEHTGLNSTYGGSVLSFPMVWHQVHLPVWLGAGGTNIVKLQAGTAGGLNVDELRVFPADAAQPEPDQQNFISLDTSPTLDATTAVRRTAYGDQLPVRVANSDNPIATFVYPRTAADPSAELVRASFVRSGTNFASLLGRVTNNLYIGRTSAGGEGGAIDLDANGVSDVSFSTNCGFVLQTTNSLITALEADRFVSATYHTRTVLLAPFSPVIWSDTAGLWNNIPVPAVGRHFEVALDFTPSSTNTEALLGFAGEGATTASNLVAAVRFGSDGLVTPVMGTALVNLPYQAGVSHRLRVEFDLILRRYNIWVKPGGGAEVQLVAGAALPVAAQVAGDLDTFAYFEGAASVANLTVTVLPEVSLAIVNPTVSTVTLAGTNVILQLVGAISNASGVVPTAWAKANGPGAVTFGSSNALSTMAQFSVPGIYSLTFGIAGGSASTNLTVTVLQQGPGLTNGLAAWWKMDETVGSIAADSSGNGRSASVVSGSFVGGYVSNAVQFTSASGRATYSAQESNRVTLAAWVRCDTTGGGTFPRIVQGLSYRLSFRFSSSDPYSVGFATQDGTNGDWDSGGGSISLGQWCHVAVSYDRSNLTNLPVFYVNGVRRSTVTLAMPSGAAPTFTGTGYIGNRSDLSRAWNGLIDDLRIYDRLLSEGEVLTLALPPTANVGPVVSAGTNQDVAWPGWASLTGTVSDDGNPLVPGAISAQWSQLSGSGTASFGDPHSSATTVAFSAPGVYGLQLAASDGQVTTASQVFVTATAPPTVAWQLQSGVLHLSWVGAGDGWQLQVQTNSASHGLGTNWVEVPGSTTTNQMDFNINPAAGGVFYRLIQP